MCSVKSANVTLSILLKKAKLSMKSLSMSYRKKARLVMIIHGIERPHKVRKINFHRKVRRLRNSVVIKSSSLCPQGMK
jgi:hypothetical protein